MNYGMDYQGGDAYGGGGGGFNAGGDNAFSQNSQGGGGGGGQRRNYDEQTIIPVTARMILASQVDPSDAGMVKLEDDRNLHHVKLVGAIRSVEQNSTNYNYVIEDGTGIVEVKQWIDENGCTALQEQIAKAAENEGGNQYVKILGKIKYYDSKMTIVADTVRVLTTGNELTHHFLEVVYSGEKFKNSATIVQPHSPMMSFNQNSGNMGSGGVGFGGSSGGRGRTPLQQQGGQSSGNATRDDVMRYIQHNSEINEMGANIDACIRSLPQHNESEIRAAIDYFQAEGMIYSTVNEDNFKSAM